MDLTNLEDLPPLPPSLRSLLKCTSQQWREMEKTNTMRFMIEQDMRSINRSPIEQINRKSGSSGSSSSSPDPRFNGNGSGSSRSSPDTRQNSVSRLDAKLAHLRREMVALRQMDTSLLCQLWSLNASIQEVKQEILEEEDEDEEDDVAEEEAVDPSSATHYKTTIGSSAVASNGNPNNGVGLTYAQRYLLENEARVAAALTNNSQMRHSFRDSRLYRHGAGASDDSSASSVSSSRGSSLEYASPSAH